MKQVARERAVDIVFTFFTQSHDYNGILLRNLAVGIEISFIETIEIVKELVVENIFIIQTGINPHIITFLGTIDQQLEILEKAKGSEIKIINAGRDIKINTETLAVCVYPTQNYLSQKISFNHLDDRPFTRMLALGYPQLGAEFFDIEVLERYSKDPRFLFNFKDYHGGISYRIDENDKPQVPERDQIFLKSFGLGRDKLNSRVAVVYLRYLKDLTPQHQRYWYGFQNSGDCRMYEEYYLNTIEGNWSTSHSVFSGFLYEQETLNELAKAIFGEPLFLKNFTSEQRPDNFDLLFIPSLLNYENFILTLDKIISDNINKRFFDTVGIEDTKTEFRKNGTSNIIGKGTLAMLEEWLEREIRMTDGSIAALMQPLKAIRKERQNPAHKINKNVYDISLIDEQEKHIWAAYSVMRNLRTIFRKHPLAASVGVPKWLDSNNVKAF